ncbi:hypothetical protein M5W70_18820 [Paenibacillus larvae]|nr:hypothetical protein [Paenibacillus larvae]MCY9690672.1 hypothetical protein [Paenibacillus larvae]
MIGVGGKQARVREMFLAPQHAAQPTDLMRGIPAGLLKLFCADDSQAGAGSLRTL